MGLGAFNAMAMGTCNVAIAPGPLTAMSALDNITAGSSALVVATTNSTNISVGSNALKVHTGRPAVTVGNGLTKNTWSSAQSFLVIDILYFQ
jgi:hypothetical protein